MPMELKSITLYENYEEKGLTTKLHVAAAEEDVEEVEKLLSEGYAVDARDMANSTPLHAVCGCFYSADKKTLSNRIKIMKLLLDSGADVNAVDDENRTPMHLECKAYSQIPKGEFEECKATIKNEIELLKQYGANMNIKDKDGKTARDLMTEKSKNPDGEGK